MTLEQAIAILIPAMPFLLAVAGALYQGLLHRLPTSQASQLNGIVSTVVNGVEQAGKAQPMSNADKKAAAVTAVTAIAKAAGLGKYATPTMVDMLIEAAVFAMNQAAGNTGMAGVAPQTMPAL